MDRDLFAIVAAAGSGLRARFDKNKLLATIDGEPVVKKTVGVFLRAGVFDRIIVTSSEADFAVFSEIFEGEDKVLIVRGGKTRTESVKNALAALDGKGIVLIHDGARPYLSPSLIDRCVRGAKEYGSAIAAVPPVDTLAFTNGDRIEKTTRENVFAVQTPQAFDLSLIKKAYSMIKEDDNFTDDAGVFCKYIGKAHIVEGEKENVKLTYRKDFMQTDLRVGTGFDLHRLVEGRKLILGGVEIPHVKGLLGHSDADVLIHAVMDALLSAASLRDIGYHFPDTDPRYKGISSMLLFKEVVTLLKNEGYAVNNISATIMAEKPKLMKFVPEMTKNVAAVAGIPEKDVGIGCTTLEGLGIVGREEGIAVQAYCSIKAVR